MSGTKLLIFDWDGTLVDSVHYIAVSMQAAAIDQQVEVPTLDSVKNIVGLGLPEACRILFPALGAEATERLCQSYSAHYNRHRANQCPLFSGVRDTLLELRSAGYQLAVATGKSRNGLNRALAEHALEALFDASRCADETRSKPDPMMLAQLLQEFSIEPSQAIMIGDTEYDLQMAVNARLPRIGVSYGAHSRQRLMRHDPLACADEFAEIKSPISQYFNQGM